MPQAGGSHCCRLPRAVPACPPWLLPHPSRCCCPCRSRRRAGRRGVAGAGGAQRPSGQRQRRLRRRHQRRHARGGCGWAEALLRSDPGTDHGAGGQREASGGAAVQAEPSLSGLHPSGEGARRGMSLAAIRPPPARFSDALAAGSRPMGHRGSRALADRSIDFIAASDQPQAAGGCPAAEPSLLRASAGPGRASPAYTACAGVETRDCRAAERPRHSCACTAAAAAAGSPPVKASVPCAHGRLRHGRPQVLQGRAITALWCEGRRGSEVAYSAPVPSRASHALLLPPLLRRRFVPRALNARQPAATCMQASSAHR